MAIPAGYGRASIEFVVSGIPGPLVMTFGFTDDPPSTADDIAERISDAWVAQFDSATALASSYTIDKVRVSINRGGVDLAGEFDTAETGGVGDVAVPPQVCALVTKRTGMGGRKGKGRCYLVAGYISEGNVGSDGTIGGVLRGDITTAWAAFIVALATDSLTMVLLHADASTPTGVIDGACELTVATQRRRTSRY